MPEADQEGLEAQAKAVLGAASHMNLLMVPASEASDRLADAVVQAITAYEANTGRTRARKAKLTAFRSTVAKTLADLLVAARDKDLLRRVHDNSAPGGYTEELSRHDGWCFHSLGAEAFLHDDDAPSHIDFRACIAGLKGCGLIETKGGYAVPGSFWRSGHTARFRATPDLIDLAAGFGIDVTDITNHFLPALPQNVIELRDNPPRDNDGKRIRDSSGNKVSGKRLPLPDTPAVQAMKADISELNKATVGHLSGSRFLGYRRIFNDRSFQRGGRLYAVNGDSFQQDSQSKRLETTIDGERVVELDLAASHLTMIHGLLNAPYDPARSDPYAIEMIPRDVVKAWVTLALGLHAVPTQWGKGQDKETKARYSVTDVGKLVVTRHPVLIDWFKGSVDAMNLQFIESEAMIQTMLSLLRDHGMLSFTVHDSLIVRKHDARQAILTLKTEYHRQCGVVPRIRLRHAPDVIVFDHPDNIHPDHIHPDVPKEF